MHSNYDVSICYLVDCSCVVCILLPTPDGKSLLGSVQSLFDDLRRNIHRMHCSYSTLYILPRDFSSQCRQKPAQENVDQHHFCTDSVSSNCFLPFLCTRLSMGTRCAYSSPSSSFQYYCLLDSNLKACLTSSPSDTS